MNSPTNIINEVTLLGEKKGNYSWLQQLTLAFLGGMFIGLAGVASTIASAMIENPSFAKLISSLVFPFGLLMIVITGAELFTSNSLIVISVVEKKTKILKMIKNLALVYLGNALGAIFIVILLYFAKTFTLFNGAVGQYAMQISEAKSKISFLQAFSSGILCNILVCFAIWMSFATKRMPGKMFIIYFPVMLFVLSGFEHSIANFYYGPAGIASSIALNQATDVTFFSFLINNILPVTLGNLVGGVIVVGLGTWGLYKKKQTKA